MTPKKFQVLGTTELKGVSYSVRFSIPPKEKSSAVNILGLSGITKKTDNQEHGWQYEPQQAIFTVTMPWGYKRKVDFAVSKIADNLEPGRITIVRNGDQNE